MSYSLDWKNHDPNPDPDPYWVQYGSETLLSIYEALLWELDKKKATFDYALFTCPKTAHERLDQWHAALQNKPYCRKNKAVLVVLVKLVSLVSMVSFASLVSLVSLES